MDTQCTLQTTKTKIKQCIPKRIILSIHIHIHINPDGGRFRAVDLLSIFTRDSCMIYMKVDGKRKPKQCCAGVI